MSLLSQQGHKMDYLDREKFTYFGFPNKCKWPNKQVDLDIFSFMSGVHLSIGLNGSFQSFAFSLDHLILKFMFSKKATKIDELFTVDLTLYSKCQINGEDFFDFSGLRRKHKLYDQA